MNTETPGRARRANRYTMVFLGGDTPPRPIPQAGGSGDGPRCSSDAAGTHGPFTGGQILFGEYAEQYWLPNHPVEETTREGYAYVLHAHLMPFFGHRRVVDIAAITIRQWLTMLKAAELSASNRRMLKMVLSAVLTSAVDDDLIPANPCHRVKTDPVPARPLKIVTPAQVKAFLDALPNAMSRLLAECAIETGMRWGELTELRSKDFDQATGVFTLARGVVKLIAKNQPDGQAFRVKDYPKDKEYRLIRVDAAFAAKIAAHIDRHRLADDDLLFWYEALPTEPRWTSLQGESGTWGYTGPGANGRAYAHGTTTAYNQAKCRCQYCKAAMAAYRSQRRAGGKDNPRPPRTVNTDGHIPNQWFTDNIIKPALVTTGLPPDTRMHRLRHAHASWLLAGGADLMVVKERLGHASITTTERYLHTLDNADTTALTALDKVRKGEREAPSGSMLGTSSEANQPTLQGILAKLEELQGLIVHPANRESAHEMNAGRSSSLDET
jgi:integrase